MQVGSSQSFPGNKGHPVMPTTTNLSWVVVTIAVPLSRVGQGPPSPKVKTHFVWTHLGISPPSPASWVPAFPSPVPFRGMLFTPYGRCMMLSPKGALVPCRTSGVFHSFYLCAFTAHPYAAVGRLVISCQI